MYNGTTRFMQKKIKQLGVAITSNFVLVLVNF